MAEVIVADLFFGLESAWKRMLKLDGPEVVMTAPRTLAPSGVPFVPSTCRKRRRQDDCLKIKEFSLPPILGPTDAQLRYPRDLSECAQCVLDALACILPLDIRLNLFGFAHSMVLVGVLYKHGNLSWIVVNRVNFKLYVASHFVADVLHLFNRTRRRLGFDDDRKWNRQGINEIITMAQSPALRDARNVRRMNSLPKGVLRFNSSTRSFNESLDFLRGVGPSGQFLREFSRKQPAPQGYVLPPESLCRQAMGWKIFKKTTVDAPCKSSCLCHLVDVPKGQTVGESVVNLVFAVPSSFEKIEPEDPFAKHFKPFVDYMRANPALGFYPLKDE